MPKKTIDPRNVYELIESDTEDLMVLIYASETQPQSPFFQINEKRKTIELYRAKNDLIIINNLKSETIEKLRNISQLYICEMKYNEDPNAENEVIYAYTAQKREPATDKKEETLSEKARKARELITKKSSGTNQ